MEKKLEIIANDMANAFPRRNYAVENGNVVNIDRKTGWKAKLLTEHNLEELRATNIGDMHRWIRFFFAERAAVLS